MGTLAASLELAVSLLKGIHQSEDEQEETLTGTLFGSLIAANALLSHLGQDCGLQADQCLWGMFDKYGPSDDPKSEAGSGADFAMLLLLPNGGARLAIFQAKRVKRLTDGTATFSARRVSSSESTKSSRSPQIIMLVETARRILDRAPLSPQRRAALPRFRHDPITATIAEITEASLGDFDWVHYLVYSQTGADCVPLRCLSRAYLNERDGVRTTSVRVEGVSWPFTQVLSAGLIPQSAHWLDFPRAIEAAELLPELTTLLPDIVGDSSGGRQLALLQGLSSVRTITIDLTSPALLEACNAIRSPPSSDEEYHPPGPSPR